MTLWLHSYASYPSYSESGAEWRGTDYDAMKFTHSLKGRSINGYARLQDHTGNWHKITSENPNAAFDIFGKWGAAKLVSLGISSPSLVPVPASCCIALNTDEKGRRLATAISGRVLGANTWEALHWQHDTGKSATGGTRDPNQLFANLMVLDPAKPRRIVLIDDVVTTAGHLTACASALRSFGHTVEHAIVAVQTVWDHPAKGMFSPTSRNLEP